MPDLEQRVCIKFCVKLGKTASETYKMLKEAFGDDAISRSSTFGWFLQFKRGRTSFEDYKRSGRPAIIDKNIEKVGRLIHNDPQQSIKKICSLIGISHNTCKRILKDKLNLEWTKEGWLPIIKSDMDNFLSYDDGVIDTMKEELEEDEEIMGFMGRRPD